MNICYYSDGHDVQSENVLLCWYRDSLINIFGCYKTKQSFYFHSFTVENKFPRLFQLGFAVWLFKQGWKASATGECNSDTAGNTEMPFMSEAELMLIQADNDGLD